MNDIKAQVKALLETAAKYQFTVDVSSDTVIRISRKFEPGNRSVFVECDMMAQCSQFLAKKLENIFKGDLC
jgi:hypothetical protein